MTPEQKFCMSNFVARGRTLSFSVFAFAAVAIFPSAKAQTSQDRAQLTRDQTATAPGPTVTTTGVDDTHVVTSPNDEDLGEQQILKKADSYQAFTASVGAPFYWTSNVALTNEGEQSDFLVSPVAAIAYQPRLTQTLYGLISVREQMFYYDRLTSFDFGSFDVEVGFTYQLPQFHNLVLHAEYDYNRLTEKNSFNDFFSNHIITVSAEMPFPLSRAQQLSVGADVNFSITATPEPPRRDDFEVYLGYSVQLARALFLSATGRLVLHDYVLSDRLDVSEVVALSANYSISKYLSASAIASFAANQSNHSTFDYHVVNGGGAVSLSIRF
ncbi:MAG: hypothetical protein JWO45_1821 [Spartobacteria bacterium]|nr:hypothetical protein [Spartobacteria bacterium]